MKSGSVARLVIPLCLAWAGCHGCSATPASRPQAEGSPPVIEVVGTESLADLGAVVAGSRHVVVFVVSNPADQPLVLRTVRGDCECISAIDAPDRIPAQGSARISVSYLAPQKAMAYESRLLIATDNPNRRLISLRVKSNP